MSGQYRASGLKQFLLQILDFLTLLDSGTLGGCLGKLGDVVEVLAQLQGELSEVQQGFLKMQVRS